MDWAWIGQQLILWVGIVVIAWCVRKMIDPFIEYKMYLWPILVFFPEHRTAFSQEFRLHISTMLIHWAMKIAPRPENLEIARFIQTSWIGRSHHLLASDATYKVIKNSWKETDLEKIRIGQNVKD